MTERKKPLDAARQALAAKARRFQMVFSTPEGKQVLKDLESEFDSDLIHAPGDPYSTSYNLGRRDVVVYIRQLLRYNHE